jgi:hypothetical protein
MDNRDARISALRRYISLLRHEEERANRLRYSPTAHDFNLASTETHLRTAAQKIAIAGRELRYLEKR